MLEIDAIPALVDWLNADPAEPAAVQDLDLGAHTERLLQRSFPGSLFLGCVLSNEVAGHLVATGATVIPDLDELEFAVHRRALYSVEELFGGFDPSKPDGYAATMDNRVYQQYLAHGKEARSIRVSLARRLHDHSITDAIEELIDGRKVVAVMGGHGMERSDPFYAKVAHVSRRLTQAGFLMVSGGGPGAMEATHVGAYFATRSAEALDTGIQRMATRPTGALPGKEYADRDWLHRAWAVLEAFPLAPEDEKACESLGIPTWLYGHEPPAPFATKIGKYFANSVREDGLLAIARHGVVFAPGSAGTTQEIFQDAAQNHYANQGVRSPMILFGEEHWTKVRPVWPLLQHVAKGKIYDELLALTDSEDEIVRRIQMYDPELYRA